jgi:Trp operon repressor
MKQEFRVVLRVFTESLSEKKLTEERVKKILKKALDPDEMDDVVEQVRFGDVVEDTPKK